MGKIWFPTPVLLFLSPTFITSFEFISGVGGVFGVFWPYFPNLLWDFSCSILGKWAIMLVKIGVNTNFFWCNTSFEISFLVLEWAIMLVKSAKNGRKRLFLGLKCPILGCFWLFLGSTPVLSPVLLIFS